MKNNLRDTTRKIGYFTAAIGSGLLVGTVGGILIASISKNPILRVLMTIGWAGLTYEVPEKAADGMTEYVDTVFDLVEAKTKKV